jgi:CHAT domain-containing protein
MPSRGQMCGRTSPPPPNVFAKARRVLVSPDGALAAIPFGLLAPGREVAYVPSGTSLVLLRGRARRSGTGVLALGDPQRAGGLVSGRLMPLPTTAEEANAVGEQVLLAEEATLPRLTAALAGRARWSAVHIASHCLVHPSDPDLSALAVTPGPDDDGLWTAVEIEHAHIDADLVVLSAVDSARCTIVPAEGPISLARAFLVAGASCVVASLGIVDDDSTLALMRALHERWKRGLPAASALREAQEEVRSHERWRHPYYWAPWILLGLPD